MGSSPSDELVSFSPTLPDDELVRSVQTAVRFGQIGIFLVPASRPAVTAPVSDFSPRIH